MVNGKVKFFDSRKGFGFITMEDGKDIFVHASNVDEGLTLADDMSVAFEIEQTDRGPKAVQVCEA